MRLLITSLLAISAISIAAPQTPFLIQPSASSASAESTLPSLGLASVGEDTHSSFTHASFPGYGLRIKQTPSSWCDPTVRSFTGYIDVTGYGQSLFFYFFESRSKPAEDDVIFWINGGPGASSAFGLFMELGPCRINAQTEDLVFNPHSWNSNANIFFLDQPAGVGFSFSQSGQPIHQTTEDAAVDVQAFVTMWFETFKEFQGRKFHMSGESYGGRYLPVFASAIIDGNRMAAKRNLTEINLQSVLVGNGWTDSLTMFEGYVQQQCTSYSGRSPIQTIATCVKLNEALPLCQKMFQAECRDRFDLIACGNAVDFCTSITIAPFRETGKNWYDIHDDCEPECLADPLERALHKYLNLPSTYATLGIDPAFPNGSWALSSESVSKAFGAIGSGARMDVHHKTYLYVAGLLENGVRVLIYAGKTDFACNALGIAGWLKTLPWTGLGAYLAAPVRDWFVPGTNGSAGQVRKAGLLSFVEVEGAGHLVPLHKPVESLWMLTRWLAGKDL